MATSETSKGRARIDAWLSAEIEMESLRREEIRRSTAEGIRAVIPTVDLMIRLGVEPTADTGLIEQQAWFSKLRHG
ncbi:MAG TPA: hypothetical protein VMM36_04640 [Opitutaceae bacterium]|nr:hypothetical protein [Opitutaceae bacterium]